MAPEAPKMFLENITKYLHCYLIEIAKGKDR